VPSDVTVFSRSGELIHFRLGGALEWFRKVVVEALCEAVALRALEIALHQPSVRGVNEGVFGVCVPHLLGGIGGEWEILMHVGVIYIIDEGGVAHIVMIHENHVNRVDRAVP